MMEMRQDQEMHQQYVPEQSQILRAIDRLEGRVDSSIGKLEGRLDKVVDSLRDDIKASASKEELNKLSARMDRFDNQSFQQLITKPANYWPLLIPFAVWLLNQTHLFSAVRP